tara:strand:+ start:741 stop:1529 length:789 start_codon:yes stop_codon:yes gene_type:complete
MKPFFLIFGVIIVLMLFAARKESGKHVDIEKVEHGHIVHHTLRKARAPVTNENMVTNAVKNGNQISLDENESKKTVNTENRLTIIVTGLESSGTKFVSKEIAASFGYRKWDATTPYCIKHANTTVYHISLPHNAICKSPVNIHHDIPCTRSLPGGRTILNITAELEENPNIKIVVVHRYEPDQITSQKRDHSGGADCYEQNKEAVKILHLAQKHYPHSILHIEYESLETRAEWEKISRFVGTQVSNAYKDFKLSIHSTFRPN